MLRLIGVNLPNEAKAKPNPAPICRIFHVTSRTLAPIARINFYAKYGDNPGFSSIQAEVPPPISVGNYYRVNLGYKAIAINSVNNLALSVRKSSLQTNSFWFEDSFLSIFSATEDLSSDLVIQSTANISTPPPSLNYRYVLDISGWHNFALTNVFASGLKFSSALNPESPASYEFMQVGSKVIIVGSPSSMLKVGSAITLSGTQTVTLLDPQARVGMFDLSASGIRNLDKLDYLGYSFTLATDPLNPQVGEFLWDEQVQRVAVFFSIEVGWSLVVPHVPPRNYRTAIANLSF